MKDMKSRRILLATAICSLMGGLSAQPIPTEGSKPTTRVERTIDVKEAGTMVEQLTEDEANQITHLTLTGELNAIDFRHLRDEFLRLEELDLTDVRIKAYSGKKGTCTNEIYVYLPHAIPERAFATKTGDSTYVGKESLRRIILPKKVKFIREAAFSGCNNLEICQIDRSSPPALYRGAMSDTVTAIFVPQGSLDAYRMKEKWEGFAFLEGEPVMATVQISRASSLADELAAQGLQPGAVHYLTVEGKLDANDFLLIRDYMPLLVSVNLEKCNATSIPDFTFTQKKYLLRMKLPRGLKTIGQRAFSGCGRLSGTLVLPAGVTAIEMGAFMGCEKLSRVLVTGRELTTVGENLFGGAKGVLVYGDGNTPQ